MQCPECGFMLSAFDKTCPRCENYRQQGKKPPSGLKIPRDIDPTPVLEPQAPRQPPGAAQATPGVIRASQTGPLLDPSALACAVCGSPSAQKVTSLCQSGTWTTHSRGQFVGVGSDGQGHTAMIGGPTSSTSHGMTGLAARLMPPARPFFWPRWTAATLVPLLLLPLALALDAVGIWAATAAVVCVSVLWFSVYRGAAASAATGQAQLRINLAQWEHGMQVWSRLFYCARCDHVYDAQTRDAAPLPSMNALLFADAPRPALPVTADDDVLDFRSEETFRATLLTGGVCLAVLALLWGGHWYVQSQRQQQSALVERLRKPLAARYAADLPRVNGLITQGQQVTASTGSPDDFSRAEKASQLSTDVGTLQTQRDSVGQGLSDMRAASDADDVRSRAQQAGSDLAALERAQSAVEQDIQALSDAPVSEAASAPDGDAAPGGPPAFVMRTRAGGGPPPNWQPLTKP